MDDERAKYLAEKEEETKLLANIKSVEAPSVAVARVLNNLIAEYCETCDSLVYDLNRLMKDIKKGRVTKYSELQLNPKCIELATEMYKMTDGLIMMGGKSDVAKIQRQAAFNDAFNKTKDGTIPDKTAEANSIILDELLVEKICDRAYTIITQKIKSANRVLEAMKKVITSIIVDKEVFRKEAPVHDSIDGQELSDVDDGRLPEEGDAL